MTLVWSQLEYGNANDMTTKTVVLGFQASGISGFCDFRLLGFQASGISGLFVSCRKWAVTSNFFKEYLATVAEDEKHVLPTMVVAENWQIGRRHLGNTKIISPTINWRKCCKIAPTVVMSSSSWKLVRGLNSAWRLRK